MIYGIVAVNVIIEGLNWLFEVYNGTRTLINEDGKSIDEKSVNEAVKDLSDAVSDNDDMALSKALVRLAEFVKELREAGSRYI